jgi:hypothetical protein
MTAKFCAGHPSVGIYFFIIWDTFNLSIPINAIQGTLPGKRPECMNNLKHSLLDTRYQYLYIF